MTTLIAQYNSSGCIGRCDANCHEAKEPDCDCICGGRYHGKGSKEAQELRTQEWQAVLDDIQDRVNRGELSSCSIRLF